MTCMRMGCIGYTIEALEFPLRIHARDPLFLALTDGLLGLGPGETVGLNDPLGPPYTNTPTAIKTTTATTPATVPPMTFALDVAANEMGDCVVVVVGSAVVGVVVAVVVAVVVMVTARVETVVTAAVVAAVGEGVVV